MEDNKVLNKGFVEAWFSSITYLLWSVAERKYALPMPRIIEKNLTVEEHSVINGYEVEYFDYNDSLWAAFSKVED